MHGPAWLADLLKSEELPDICRLISSAGAATRFVADDASYELLEAEMSRTGLPSSSLIRSRHFAIRLMLDFGIQRVVVIDAHDEEASRAKLLDELRGLHTPSSILATMRFQTFVADWIAAYAAGAPQRLKSPDVGVDMPNVVYVVVSTPRAGSTFLASTLSSVGFGSPVEHVRPWLIRLLMQRPPSLFNGIRFMQTMLCVGARSGCFGTKIIAHFIDEAAPLLSAAERSYVLELLGRVKVVYLYRQDKLDQAISSLRAHKTGVWHVTDPELRSELEPSDLQIDPADLDREVEAMTVAEQALADKITRLKAFVTVSYEELANPAVVVARIAGFLQLDPKREPSSAYVKLADAASDAVRVGYLEERSGADPLSRLRGVDEEIAQARRRAEHQAEDTLRCSGAIRHGHATSRAGDYQDRHYYLLDYRSTHLPGLVFPCRGPTPRNVDAGGYIAFIGAAQTFGAFVQHPFSEQVGEAFGREVLNLGRGGGGPSFFTALPRVLELVGKAEAVVVQAMASRMISNSQFTSLEGRAAVRYREDDGSETVMDCDQAWTRALTTRSQDQVRALVEESRRGWVEGMRALARAARGPKVLLYFGMRPTDYEIAYRDVWSLYGEFPQMVTSEMIDAVRPEFDRYVEVVSTEGLPELMRSAFSGELLPVVFGGGKLDEQTVETQNIYYPSQAMHAHAATALIEALGDLLPPRMAMAQ